MIGIYQCIIGGEQGVPFLDISYLSFSSMLGVGIILSIYLAGESGQKNTKLALWALTLLLLFVQLNQHGRGPLLATLLASVLLIFLRYKSEKKIFLSITVCFVAIAVMFTFKGGMQQRLAQVQNDIELSRQGKMIQAWATGLPSGTLACMELQKSRCSVMEREYLKAILKKQ